MQLADSTPSEKTCFDVMAVPIGGAGLTTVTNHPAPAAFPRPQNALLILLKAARSALAVRMKLLWVTGSVVARNQWGNAVKGLEAAMRKALQGPGGSNPRQRQRIYAQARKALVNGLAKQGQAGTDRARNQSHGLEKLIQMIESEYRGVAPAVGGEMRAAAPSRRSMPVQEPQMGNPQQVDPERAARWREPSLDSVVPEQQTSNTRRRQPAHGRPLSAGPGASRLETSSLDAAPLAEHLGTDFGSGDREFRRQDRPLPVQKKRRRPIFSLILVSALAIAFLGIGIVWVVVGGILEPPAQRDTSVPNPPAKIDSEDFAGLPSPDGAFSGDWVNVFLPQDLSRVTGRGAAQVELVETDNREALRIVSNNAETEGEALFELGPGVMQNLGGGQALVAMTLRSITETPTQIYVRCLLPGNGDCGRHRFDVTYEAGDVIFSLDLTSRSGSEPAYLAVNSDVSGAGNGIEVYGIRVRPQ